MKREFRPSQFGWWLMMIGIILWISVAGIMLLLDAITEHANKEFIFSGLNFIIFIVVVRFLLLKFPFRIVVREDNYVEFYTRGGVTVMPVTDIRSFHSNNGVWLRHARGKFVFAPIFYDPALWDFIKLVAKLNPEFREEGVWETILRKLWLKR